MSHRHEIEIRYGECDQQGIVFNANYLAYVDDAMDHWMRSVAADEWVSGWDVMLKRAQVVWQSPARWRDVLVVDSAVARWGRTSFDVLHRLSVEGVDVADVLITYVSVSATELRPIENPPAVVLAMGEPVDLPDSLR